MTLKIPIYILTGFLGAGKTTLLKTLLSAVKAQGRQPAVLMNEFGQVSVDSLLLQHTSVPVVDLIEGCVCCTVRGNLSAALTEMLERYTPDVLFLEATGVAIPVEIVDALLDDPLHERVQLAGILTLVDANQFPLHLPPVFEQTVLQQTMVEQVRHADVLILTKTDTARHDRRFALESFLRQLNGAAPLVRVVKGEVDADSLLKVRRVSTFPTRTSIRPERLQRRPLGRGIQRLRPAAKPQPTSFGQLQTLHYPFTHPVDADRFYELLYALPNTVLRGKGFYRDAENGQLYEFHFTPYAPMTTPAGEVAALQPFAIFIGEHLEDFGLRQRLAACEVAR